MNTDEVTADILDVVEKIVTRSFEEKPHESDALFAHEELRTISTYFIKFLHSRDVASKFDCVFYGVALGVIIEVGENVLATGELLLDPSGLCSQLLG
jgi:hypothetical protein